MQAGSHAARGNKTVNGIPNRLNYCLIFIMDTCLCIIFTDVVVGRIT